MMEEKHVFKDLLTQQINVLKAISYLAMTFMVIYLLMLYYGFGLMDVFPLIIIPYILVLLVNISLLPYHKRPYITYHSLIIATFFMLTAQMLFSGGLSSPAFFNFVLLPAFAFYTSRRQGKVWFVICLLATLVIYRAENLGVPISNLVQDQYQNTFMFVNIAFVIILNSTYTLLSKKEAMKVHRSHNTLEVDLKGKSTRLGNMVMLVNYSTELMCVIDMENLTFDEVNPEFKLSLGYELSELRDQHVRVLIKDESISFLVSAKEDDKVEFVSQVLCLNGDIRLYSWIVVAKNKKLYASAREIA